MPIYEFYDKELDHYIDVLLKISEREEYLKFNPHLKQVHTRAAGIVAGVGSMDSKIDGGMQENLQRIADAHPRSAMADKYRQRDSKEVKIDAIANKAKKRAKERNTFVQQNSKGKNI